MTRAGSPHSETLGSQPASRLPEEYRRPPRPSSAPDAKASTERSKKQTTKTHEQNKKQFCRRNLTVRCSRPLYSSQPTHPHPPTTPNNQEPQTGQATRAHCPRTPTACHPHTRGGTHHATLPTQAGSRSMTGVFPTPITRQTNHPREQTHETQSTARPFRKGRPPAGPDPFNSPSKIKTAGKPPRITNP